jgi:hypothetical protein
MSKSRPSQGTDVDPAEAIQAEMYGLGISLGESAQFAGLVSKVSIEHRLGLEVGRRFYLQTVAGNGYEAQHKSLKVSGPVKVIKKETEV